MQGTESAQMDQNYGVGAAEAAAGQRPPALGKNASASTVLARKDNLNSMQRGQPDESSDQAVKVYADRIPSEYETTLNESKTEAVTLESQVSTNVASVNNSMVAQRQSHQQNAKQETHFSQQMLERPQSQKGNRLRVNQRLERSNKSGSVVKSTTVSKGTFKNARMGSTFSHGGRQIKTKTSMSTSNIKPFDFHSRPNGVAPVHPSTLQSIQFPEENVQSEQWLMHNQPSFIPTAEILSSHGQQISINSYKQGGALPSQQQSRGGLRDSRPSMTKPLSEMERARKQDPSIVMTGKKFRKLMLILDTKVPGQVARKSQQARQSQSKTSNSQLYRASSSIQMGTTANRKRPMQALFHKSNRCNSSATFNLYVQDSEAVPFHYSRPGPADYNTATRIGKKSGVSNYTNSPGYSIPRPKTITDGFISLQQAAQEPSASLVKEEHEHLAMSRHPSSHSIGKLSQTDIGMHRFTDYAIDMKTRKKQLKMLNPSRLQTEKEPNHQSFGKEVRRDPFPVKKEHATVCQHTKRDSSLKNSLGTIPRQRREASNSVKRLVKGASPGPSDYNTTALVSKDRPLTAYKSHNMASQHFNKAKKDTMNVDLYDPAYERSYKNNIGPGPNAYSKIYENRETDRFRKTAFPKQRRLLTEGRVGPGPCHYESHVAKDNTGLIAQPRPKFMVADRSIDVIRWKQAQHESTSMRRITGPY